MFANGLSHALPHDYRKMRMPFYWSVVIEFSPMMAYINCMYLNVNLSPPPRHSFMESDVYTLVESDSNQGWKQNFIYMQWRREKETPDLCVCVLEIKCLRIDGYIRYTGLFFHSLLHCDPFILQYLSPSYTDVLRQTRHFITRRQLSFVWKFNVLMFKGTKMRCMAVICIAIEIQWLVHFPSIECNIIYFWVNCRLKMKASTWTLFTKPILHMNDRNVFVSAVCLKLT